MPPNCLKFVNYAELIPCTILITTHMIGGGMVFPRKLKDVHDFTRAVLGREAVELLDGCKSE